MAIATDMRAGDRSARASVMAAPGAGDRERALRAARRHSLLVKTLRLAFPIGAAGVVVFYALMLAISWKLGAGRFKVEGVTITADDLTMKAPSYAGTTKDGGRYEVRAKRAIVEFNQQGPIKLIDIDGDLVQTSGVVTKLKSKHGLYDNNKGELELYDGIEIDATNGLVARLSRATIYSKEHLVVSKHPVTMTMPTGSVQGATLTMKTDTREAKLRGAVAVRLVQTGQPKGGFGRDGRQPVDVYSEELDIDDRPLGPTAKTAHFKGNVVAVQGESTLNTPDLHIKYEGKGAAELAAAAPQQQQGEPGTRVTLMKARGGVVVNAGTDRRVTSDLADFDGKTDAALFAGNVVVNQGKNVLQGRRLFVDRKTNRSRLDAPAEPGRPEGRITTTFYQSDTRAAAQAKPKSTGENAKDTVFGSFRNDPNAPIDVEADTLDVDDNPSERTATFRGKVKARQGDFVVDTVEMIAHYSGQAGLGLASPGEDKGAKAQAQLTRVEARKRVLITSKDGQKASGEWATFDVKDNSVLMGGGVVVTRGKDVAEGPRLKIDLTTGMYRFELESEATTASVSAAKPEAPVAAAPAISASPAETPTHRTCPPGKQCMLFYPKDAKDKAKEGVKKLLPSGDAPKASEGWQPGTSSSPVLQGN